MADHATVNPVIMVSSTVHGIEDLLDQVYGMLRGFGYTVWMSHKGTVPVDPSKSNFENCLEAVQKCDLFLGVITPFYGSGKDGKEKSITHRELVKAIELDKLRWFLAHDHVEFARQLLRQFRFDEAGKVKRFKFQKTPVLDDIRVIDMYETAVRNEMKLSDRTGNWVQAFFRHADALEFVNAQFSDRARIQELMKKRTKP